jgi:hypothetical protein
MASYRSSICVTRRSSGTAISQSSTISLAYPAHAETRSIRTALFSSAAAKRQTAQSTISRLENLPDTRALLRLGRALIEQ